MLDQAKVLFSGQKTRSKKSDLQTGLIIFSPTLDELLVWTMFQLYKQRKPSEQCMQSAKSYVRNK